MLQYFAVKRVLPQFNDIRSTAPPLLLLERNRGGEAPIKQAIMKKLIISLPPRWHSAVLRHLHSNTNPLPRFDGLRPRRESFRLRLQPRRSLPGRRGLHRSRLPPHADRHRPRAQHRPAYGPPPRERGRSHLALRPTLPICPPSPSPQGTASSFDGGKASQTYSLPVGASWEIDIFGRLTNAAPACTSCRGAEP